MVPMNSITTSTFLLITMWRRAAATARWSRARGKESMETETWFVGTEYQLPQGVTQFLASGQNHMSPWHPRVLFEKLPGGGEESIIPSPVVTATAAFNYFVTGRPFEKVVFKD